MAEFGKNIKDMQVREVRLALFEILLPFRKEMETYGEPTTFYRELTKATEYIINGPLPEAKVKNGHTK